MWHTRLSEINLIRLWVAATGAVITLGAAALIVTEPSTPTGMDCQGRLTNPAPLSTPDREWLERCVSAFTLPTTPPTTSPGTTPPTTAPPTAPPTPDPTQACAPYPAFPDADCTGVPAGTVLSNWTSSCTITSPMTINRRLINCAVLQINAQGVLITESRVLGQVNTSSGSFAIRDSDVVAPQATATERTGIGTQNFTALRVEVTGGNRGIYCRFNCTVQDSWVHGTNIAQTPRIHASGIRQSQGARIIHNRIQCSAQDTPTGGGCSADLVGYGDFEPVQNNLIEKNLFVATPGGACAYGGSSGDDGVKPYGHLARDIRFIDNVFERGPVGDGGRRNCGFYFPITDFLHNDGSLPPGNVWTNNRWDDGGIVPPAS